MTTDNANLLPMDLSKQIIGYLRQISAEPGYRLTERALAKQFDVSRSPVRIALNLLADEGVVEAKESGGRFLAVDQKELEKYAISAPANPLGDLYDTIINEQIAGKLPEQFTEADLLRRYDVARGLLMKVLGKMSNEGLIERRQGHGWRCLPIINTMEANFKSYEFRLALEPRIILSDSFVVDKARLQRCYNLQKEMSEGRLQYMSSSEVFEANAEVHQMLADFSNNDFFHEAIRKQNQLRLIMENRAARHAARMMDSCQEHMRILEAVADGNRTTAANLMFSHLTKASQSSFGLAKLSFGS
ncbi:GntR family transcriptional regulator [Kordiimonas pumila]|uniref:GntR family transcriptional regulator n=1 Tax=Kordiimonas pumila TaxID=2161677 RepID=A0ABV7D4A7_9PROT|nr:GntR family transcriptional regulator [Kordiimonas pumila]